MKKLFIVCICILGVLSLTACESMVYDQELEDLKSEYYLEMPTPDSSLSSYYIDFDVTDDNYTSKSVYQRINDIQKWLNNMGNVDIVGIMPKMYPNDMGILGLTFFLRSSEYEHSYLISVSETTYNVEGFIAGVQIPISTEQEYFYIMIYDKNMGKKIEGNTTELSEIIIPTVEESIE